MFDYLGFAGNRAQVGDFYDTCAGAEGNGAPGWRANYHSNYKGAFEIDPNRHNIEAVCHSPGRDEQSTAKS